MSRRPKALITSAVLIAIGGLGHASQADAAFWEGKPKLEAKLRDERAVLVSVRTDKGVADPKADLFTINGVGWVKRDAAVVFKLAQHYEQLKTVSEIFREVKFESKTNRVFVICQALGYQARMLLAIQTRSAGPATASDTAAVGRNLPAQISFEVVDGHFLGLKGVMEFRELPSATRQTVASQTEVTFRVHHEAREIPIPRMLVGFALEVIVQKVAVKIRSHFEQADQAAF